MIRDINVGSVIREMKEMLLNQKRTRWIQSIIPSKNPEQANTQSHIKRSEPIKSFNFSSFVGPKPTQPESDSSNRNKSHIAIQIGIIIDTKKHYIPRPTIKARIVFHWSILYRLGKIKPHPKVAASRKKKMFILNCIEHYSLEKLRLLWIVRWRKSSAKFKLNAFQLR